MADETEAPTQEEPQKEETTEAAAEGGEAAAEEAPAEAAAAAPAEATADKKEEEAPAEDDDEEAADEEEEIIEEAPQVVTAIVPRLDDLVVKCLAENYDIFPALDRIPPEYLDNVVALLDPSQHEFTVAAKFIVAEKFWKRLCQERWPICELAQHGMSWKRMYIERHIWSLFEAYYPSNHGQNFEKLMKEINAGKPFVQTITIQQLLSHLDLCDILLNFPNLATLNLKYSARKLGMDYDKSLFGMQLKDAMSLAKFFASTRTLTRLCLNENLLNDESVHILCSGLQKNDTIISLDLSHNKIGDAGAKRISRALRGMPCLTDLNLADNNIHPEGGVELANAIGISTALRSFSIKLNPIGNYGGFSLMEAMCINKSVTALDMCGTSLTSEAAEVFCTMMTSTATLVTLDVSCNEFNQDQLSQIKTALNSNKSITQMDLRHNKIEDEGLKELTTILSARYAESKRRRRKLYQEGWDEAL